MRIRLYLCCKNVSNLMIMKINKAHLIMFSPTSTSKHVGEAIVRGTGISEVCVCDLTHPDAQLPVLLSDELVVIAVPVYGGRVAPLAMRRLEGLKADGTLAVPVVVYGNRAYEKALLELDAFATQCGCKVVAAGTFVGEHSYSTPDTPIAVGRPNADDLAVAEAFGSKVMQKITDAADVESLYSVDVSRIPRPKQPIWPMLKFVRQIMKWRKSGTPLPRTPQCDEALCTHCGLCVRLCPNEAIEKGNECHTLTDRCIKCCACVKGCPQKARTFNTPFAPLLSANFSKAKENKILL